MNAQCFVQDEMQMLEEITRQAEQEKMIPVPVDNPVLADADDNFPLLEWQPDGELKITPKPKRKKDATEPPPSGDVDKPAKH